MSPICLHKDFSFPDLKQEQFYWKLWFYLGKVGFFPSVSEMTETPRPEHTDSTSPRVSKAQGWEKWPSSVRSFLKGSRPCWQHNSQHWGGQSLIKTHLQIKSRKKVRMIFVLWAEGTGEFCPSFSTKPDCRSWTGNLMLAFLTCSEQGVNGTSKILL